MLTVVSATRRPERGYRCRCKCGNETYVDGRADLRRRGSTGCGQEDCDAVRHRSPPNAIILEPGSRFGRWTVLERSLERDRDGSRQYLCRCDCGTERLVGGTPLRTGSSKSCGCFRKDRPKDWSPIERGQRFGHLEVLGPAGTLTASAQRSKRTQTARVGRIYFCRCDCGQEYVAVGSALRHWVASGQNPSCGCKSMRSARSRKLIPRGTTIGRLVVLGFAGRNKHRQPLYVVNCECGTTKIVLGYYLQQGSTRSCGCLRKETSTATLRKHVKPHAAVVEPGERFGKLVVLQEAGRKNRERTYLVRCDCGTELEAVSSSLRSGQSSCGCANKNRRSVRPGERYGMLTVLAPSGRTKHRYRLFLMRCECGTEKVLPGSRVRSGHIRSCGCLRRGPRK